MTCGSASAWQIQIRTCIGDESKQCTRDDKERIISCRLPNCPRFISHWSNSEICTGVGGNKTCGPGLQNQKRSCSDGTIFKCRGVLKQRKVSCTLEDCPKKFGNWSNVGDCNATRQYLSWGRGAQRQQRHCIDGTTDKCTKEDQEQTISCIDAGTSFPGFSGNIAQ